MKKNVILILFVSLSLISQVFAFDGIIEQQVTINNEGAETLSTLTWYIKGDKLKLVVSGVEGKTITLIPNSKTNTLIVFSDDAKDKDGKIVYAEVGAENVQNTILNISTGEMKPTVYNGKDAKSVDVVCDGNAYLVEYLPSIDINLNAYAKLLKDNIGLQALAKLNVEGFPVQVAYAEANNKEVVLKTLSINETTVSDKEFNLSEANYIKYQ